MLHLSLDNLTYTSVNVIRFPGMQTQVTCISFLLQVISSVQYEKKIEITWANFETEKAIGKTYVDFPWAKTITCKTNCPIIH